VLNSPQFEEEITMPVEPNNPESGIIGDIEDNIIKYAFKNHPQGIEVRAG